MQSVVRLVSRLLGQAPAPAASPEQQALILAEGVPLYHPALPAILLWTHKSGCTSAIKWFLYQADLLPAALEYSGIHFYTGTIYKKSPEGRAAAGHIRQLALPLVKFTRNPYSRAVSGFLTLTKNYRAPFVQAQWRRLRGALYGDPDSAEGLSFSDYLDGLERSGVAPGQVNSHFAQQFNPAEAAFAPATYDLADMQAVFAGMQRAYGLHPCPPHFFESSHHTRYEGEALPFARVKLGPSGSQEMAPPPFASFYDDKTQAQVARLYRADFKAYGYDPGAISDNYRGERLRLPTTDDGGRERPPERSARYQLAVSRRAAGLGRAQEALEAAEAAAALEPGNAWALGQKALCLGRLGREAEAAALLRDTLARNWPAAEEAMLRRLLAERSEGAEALALLAEAVALQPENALLRQRLASRRQD